MKILKFGIAVFLFLAMVSSSLAQKNNKPQVDQRTERIIAKLNLNNTQAEKARAVSAKYRALISATDDQKKKDSYKYEADMELKSILTSEQFLHYKDILANEKKLKEAKEKRLEDSKK